MIGFYRVKTPIWNLKVRLLGGSTLRIITLNANGIRSAHRKGLFVVIQAKGTVPSKTKAHAGDLQDAITVIQGYRAYSCDAEKKGYYGVAMYPRASANHVPGSEPHHTGA